MDGSEQNRRQRVDPQGVFNLGRLRGVVLLRPHGSFHSLEGGDFDFLQEGGEDLGCAIEEEFGRPTIKIVRRYVHQRFYDWGQVDVLPSLEWNGCEYADAAAVVSEAWADEDGVKRPRLGHDGVISWLTSLLWGGFFKAKYAPVIEKAAREDGEFMREALEWALGPGWAEEMMTWALEGTCGECEKHVKGIRRAIKWEAFKRGPGDALLSRARHWKCELGHHLRPKLPLIAFLGPDGSGKSSVISGVREQLDRMGLQQRMMHWRPYGFKGREDLGVPVSNPHSDPPRSYLESVAKLGMLMVDWWIPGITVLRHARAKTSVVIADRYYADLLVDPIRYRYGASRRMAKWIFKLFPKPNLVFVFTGTAEVIHPRKEEVSLEELAEQLSRYQVLATSLGDRARLINVDKPLDEVVEETVARLREHFVGDKHRPTALAGRRTGALRVAQFVAHYPSVEGITAYCRGLSTAMNLIEPSSCPIITLRRELKHLSGQEELLHYPMDSRNPMSLPKQLLDDLETNRHELDGVVMHGTYHPKVGMLRRHLDRVGMPYIFVPHDPYVPELTRHHAIRKWVFWHLFEKRTIRNAKAVQLLAAEHEGPLRDRGFEVPVEVIPNGCELETLEHLPEKTHAPGTNKRCRIQFIGRMDRNHKGLDLLIRAFKDFIKDELAEGVDLILTGSDWEDREELEKLAENLGVSGRVTFTGPRPEHSLVILSEADLVVLPSRFDGFGLCIVEAMLAKRPVFVSRKAGVSEHVEKAGGGWLVDPTVESISEGLKRALSDRAKWPEMGIANHKYVVSELTWKQAAIKMLDMYRRRLR